MRVRRKARFSSKAVTEDKPSLTIPVENQVRELDPKQPGGLTAFHDQ